MGEGLEMREEANYRGMEIEKKKGRAASMPSGPLRRV
jgi:hypothetical protein